jgi:DNA-directed RNA polymerase specialized sigma24 family protein
MTPSPDDDSTLLQRIKAGDQAAEADLFWKYQHGVLREAMRGRLVEADAEEVASAVLCTMLDNAHAGKLKGNIRPWLMKVTKNRVIDWLRERGTEDKRQAAVAEELMLASPGSEGESASVVPYSKLLVRQAMARIREREEKQGKSAEGWSYSEILTWISGSNELADMAKWMGTSENTARQRKFRAQQMLREEVETLRARGEVVKEEKDR